MKPNAPSYQALHVFLEVLEAGSMRVAAERLHRTESAISHQMRTLERQLRQRLLERTPRGIRPTAIGARYAELLREPFAEIHRATTILFEPSETQSLTVGLAPVLASLWLVPRLGLFDADYPNLSLRLITSERPLNLAEEGIDIAVRYHRHCPSRTANRLLFQERAFPVCSPAVATSAEDLRDQLATGRILINEAQADEWRRWRNSLADPIRLSRRRERLAGSHLTLEAAAQGYGIALGREPLVSDLLRRGRLVAPLGHDYPTGGVYELLANSSAPPSTARAQVLNWLSSQLNDTSVSIVAASASEQPSS